MTKAQEENSRRIVARALKICEAKQVNATAAIVEGDAKEAICQAVDRMQAGLLVLGSRGLGKIKRYVARSVKPLPLSVSCDSYSFPRLIHCP
jgi:nucleotide-binding universal stress UspA family protein